VLSPIPTVLTRCCRLGAVAAGAAASRSLRSAGGPRGGWFLPVRRRALLAACTPLGRRSGASSSQEAPKQHRQKCLRSGAGRRRPGPLSTVPTAEYRGGCGSRPEAAATPPLRSGTRQLAVASVRPFELRGRVHSKRKLRHLAALGGGRCAARKNAGDDRPEKIRRRGARVVDSHPPALPRAALRIDDPSSSIFSDLQGDPRLTKPASGTTINVADSSFVRPMAAGGPQAPPAAGLRNENERRGDGGGRGRARETPAGISSLSL